MAEMKTAPEAEEKTKEKETELLTSENEPEEKEDEPKEKEGKSLRARALGGKNEDTSQTDGLDPKQRMMLRIVIVAVVGYLAFEYLWDYMFTQDSNEFKAAFKTTRDIEGSVLANQTKVVIMYCHQCGHAGIYEKIKNMIETQAPEIQVTGIKHMDSEANRIFAYVMTVCLVIFLTMIMAGDKIFFAMFYQVPDLIVKFQKGWKMQLAMSFILVLYIYQLTQSSAFEIYIDNHIKFSKLRSGRMIEDYDIRAVFSSYGIKP